MDNVFEIPGFKEDMDRHKADFEKFIAALKDFMIACINYGKESKNGN